MSDPLWRTHPDLYRRCSNCDGEGLVPCRPCHGKGKVYGHKRSMWAGRVISAGLGHKKCLACHGKGARRCGVCEFGSVKR